MDENMNVEELANGFVNAFSDMAKAASEFWEACNIQYFGKFLPKD